MRTLLAVLIILFLVTPAMAGENNCSSGKRLKNGERPDQTFKYGVPPATVDHCPESHPVKGNINKGRNTCIYHQVGDRWYKKTDPERCYENGDEAVKDGFRASKV